MATVKKSAQANEDLYHLWHYIAIDNHNPDNAARFIEELDAAMFSLAKSPHIGTERNEYMNGLRQFVYRKNYLIYYFPLPEGGIEVIRVLHGARDIPHIFEE